MNVMLAGVSNFIQAARQASDKPKPPGAEEQKHTSWPLSEKYA